jgi:outer membrane protein TolC
MGPYYRDADNHPSIRAAEAKVAEAQAALARVREEVRRPLALLAPLVRQSNEELASARAALALEQVLRKDGLTSRLSLVSAQRRLEKAEAEREVLEKILALLTGKK